MNLVRTSLRLEADLKKAAEQYALDNGMTLQRVFNDSLSLFLRKKTHKKSKKIDFGSHDLGVPLDNLTREDIYAD